MNSPKMSEASRQRGLQLLDALWDTCAGYSPDEIVLAALSLLATLIGNAAANPTKMAQRLAARLVATVEKPPERRSVN